MTAYPLIFTFVYSFTDYNYLKGTENASFVLFDNYVSLFKNGYFQQAVWNLSLIQILLKAETTGGPAGAMVLPDGRVVTGKTSDTLGAVSYTHLDVYKRQGLDRAHGDSDQIRLQLGAVRLQGIRQGADLHGCGSLIPVSYTHLDVYKRQGSSMLPRTGPLRRQ